jgi:hypothetical protein
MTEPMRFAYADPPYLGCAAKHYAKQHAGASLYDKIETHEALVLRLRDEFPDAWALSLSVPSLETYLDICRRMLGQNRVRVGAWVKPFASFKQGVNPGYCWEPVIFYGGRRRGREIDTLRDYVSAGITLKRGTAGAKPDAFSFWMFDFLGARLDDQFADLFPGSGAVTRAWQKWKAQTRMFA